MSFTKPTEAAAARGLLGLALVSGCALMGPFLLAGPLVLDEHGSYWIAGADNPGTLLERSLNYAALPPLSGMLQQLFMAVGGHNEAAFRASSALCYLAAIGVCYLLGREWLGPVGGGLAALLLAWHPEVVDEVRIARCYGLVLLLAACSFWITTRWLREPQRVRWVLAWSLVNAGLAWTHYMTVAVPAVELLVMAAFRPRTWRRQFTWGVAGGVLLCGLLVFPLFPTFLRMWDWSIFLNYVRQETPLWKTIGAIWWLGLPVGWCVGLLPGRITGSGQAEPSDPPAGQNDLWPLAAWSLLPLLFVAAVSHGDLTSLANPRYRISYAVPGVCLIAGCLLRRRSALAACAGGVAALAATWAAADARPWELQRIGDPREAEWAAMAEIVGRRGAPGEPLFVQSGLIESSLVPALYADPLFMDYVACRLGRFYLRSPHPRYGLPFQWHVRPDMREFYHNLLERVGASRERSLWVAGATDTDLNRESLEGIQTLLAEHDYAAVETERFEFATLIRYRRASATRPGATSR